MHTSNVVSNVVAPVEFIKCSLNNLLSDEYIQCVGLHNLPTARSSVVEHLHRQAVINSDQSLRTMDLNALLTTELLNDYLDVIKLKTNIMMI